MRPGKEMYMIYNQIGLWLQQFMLNFSHSESGGTSCEGGCLSLHLIQLVFAFPRAVINQVGGKIQGPFILLDLSNSMRSRGDMDHTSKEGQS